VKTVIYYFTGTGNSLAVARKICAGLSDCGLVPIASLDTTGGTIVPGADRVGIVCPVYFAGLPAMVARFAGRLDLKNIGHTFAVVTYGGSGASPALQQLDGILKEHTGRGLDSGYGVMMPGNYVLLYSPPAGTKREKLLAMADEQVAGMIRDIGAGIVKPLPRSFFAQLLHTLMYPRFLRTVHDADRQFSVSDACTSCGTCVGVCPAGNIELIDKKPAWKHRCELCCACIHLCPAHAIQAGKKTGKRGRYRHPDVKVADLKIGKEDTS
jgi:NAD-dependent dihydropyrimidine dehydrogenase PreA subunit